MTQGDNLQEKPMPLSYKRERKGFNIKRFFTSRIFIILLCVIIAVSSFFLGMHVDYMTRFNKADDYALLTSVIDYVNRTYYKDLDPDTVIYYACKGVVDNLDPYSKIYKETQSTDEDRGYLGIELSYGVNGEFRVEWVTKDSPADLAGIKTGDYIVSVNGRAVEGDFVEDFVALIGNKRIGDKVKLGVKKSLDQEARLVELTAIKLESDAVHYYTDFSQLPGSVVVPSNVGYIGFTGFSDEVCEEMAVAVKSMVDTGKTRIILDLRGNTGGDGSALTKIAGYFLKPNQDGSKKKIMRVVDSSGDSHYYTTTGNEKYIFDNVEGGKIIVLVDNNTASAAEALTGALIVDGDCELVGVNTYGKGVGQSTVPFPSASEPLFNIKLTIGKYYFEGDVSSYVKGAEGYVDSIDGVGFSPKQENTLRSGRVNSLMDDPVVQRAIYLTTTYE